VIPADSGDDAAVESLTAPGKRSSFVQNVHYVLVSVLVGEPVNLGNDF
jgi:hypothetical protein